MSADVTEPAPPPPYSRGDRVGGEPGLGGLREQLRRVRLALVPLGREGPKLARGEVVSQALQLALLVGQPKRDADIGGDTRYTPVTVSDTRSLSGVTPGIPSPPQSSRRGSCDVTPTARCLTPGRGLRGHVRNSPSKGEELDAAADVETHTRDVRREVRAEKCDRVGYVLRLACLAHCGSAHHALVHLRVAEVEGLRADHPRDDRIARDAVTRPLERERSRQTRAVPPWWPSSSPARTRRACPRPTPYSRSAPSPAPACAATRPARS